MDSYNRYLGSHRSVRELSRIWEKESIQEEINKQEGIIKGEGSSVVVSTLNKSSDNVKNTAQKVEDSSEPFLELKNFNNGESLVGVKDSQISKLIKSRIPPNTYGQISVNKVKYKFEGEENPIKARKIVLSRAKTAVTAVSMKTFIASLFGNKEKQSEKFESLLDLTVIKEGLIGDCEKDEEKKKLEEEMTKAFIRCTNIKLIISDDCNFAEIRGDQSSVFVLARRVGQQTRFLIAEVSALMSKPIKINKDQ